MTYDEYCEKVFELIEGANYITRNSNGDIFWWYEKPNYQIWNHKWNIVSGYCGFLGCLNYPHIEPELSIRQRKWVPKEGEVYYYPCFVAQEYSFDVFCEQDSRYKFLSKNELCFKHAEEAIACTKKMLELYKSSLK